MANLNGFDASGVEPSKELELIPPGKYLAAIVESEEKQTANGAGSYHKLVFEILEGRHKGRKLFVNLNLRHSKAQTVQIAQRDLSAICHAVGVIRPNDTQELHRLPMCVSVKAVKRKDNGELRNEIKGWYPKADYTAEGAMPIGAPAGAAASGPGAAPWVRR